MSAFLLLSACLGYSQLVTSPDSLRGSLRHERTSYDVEFYDLTVDILPDSQFISGQNIIRFIALDTTTRIQIDLFKQFEIHRVILRRPINGTGLFEIETPTLTRIGAAMFFHFEKALQKNERYELVVSYSGKPNIAKKAPWDGGFVWSKDSLGRDFCGVACEGWGASSWWPCKDHLSDEPDSMRMTFSVPSGYTSVGNGQLINHTSVQAASDPGLGSEVFTWYVSNPINSYNVTFYLGKFIQQEDWYLSGSDSLKLDYYVLDYNAEKAKTHFKVVKPMLAAYEKLFGKYPFWEDGYKLVEAPYLGMEHQSAIAYGNKYKKGYLGYHAKGIDFDYIVVHESGHEYWGNSVSMSDLADMWIHESFCTYTEVLYTELMYGDSLVPRYLKRQRQTLSNDAPIIGNYGVNEEGSGDMYHKGSLMLHTIRNYVNNDSIWFATLKSFHEDFKLKITNTKEVLDWFEGKLGAEVRAIFERYLYNAALPVLEIKSSRFLWMRYLKYRWKSEEDTFDVNVLLENRGARLLNPTKEWQRVRVDKSEEISKCLIWHYSLYDIELLQKQ